MCLDYLLVILQSSVALSIWTVMFVFCFKACFGSASFFTNFVFQTFIVICPRPKLLFLCCQYIAHHIPDILSNKLQFFSCNCTSCWFFYKCTWLSYFYINEKVFFLHMFWTCLPHSLSLKPITGTSRNTFKYPSSDARTTCNSSKIFLKFLNTVWYVILRLFCSAFPDY